MKKIFTILIMTSLVLFMFGCTQDTSDNNTQGDNVDVSAEDAEIDITLDEMSNDLNEIQALIEESDNGIEDANLDETII